MLARILSAWAAVTVTTSSIAMLIRESKLSCTRTRSVCGQSGTGTTKTDLDMAEVNVLTNLFRD